MDDVIRYKVMTLPPEGRPLLPGQALLLLLLLLLVFTAVATMTTTTTTNSSSSTMTTTAVTVVCSRSSCLCHRFIQPAQLPSCTQQLLL